MKTETGVIDAMYVYDISVEFLLGERENVRTKRSTAEDSISLYPNCSGNGWDRPYSPQISMKTVLGENQVNEILKAWVANRKDLQKLLQH
jgi:hypothetical protein